MFYKKVLEYCEENNISISAFEKKCNIGNGTVGRWKEDGSKPTLSTIEKIAEATEIPAADWLK